MYKNVQDVHQHVQKTFIDTQKNKEIWTCKSRCPDVHTLKKGLGPKFLTELGYPAAMLA